MLLFGNMEHSIKRDDSMKSRATKIHRCKISFHKGSFGNLFPRPLNVFTRKVDAGNPKSFVSQITIVRGTYTTPQVQDGGTVWQLGARPSRNFVSSGDKTWPSLNNQA